MAVQIIRDFTGRNEVKSQEAQVRPQARADQAPAPGQPSFSELVKDFAADVNEMQFTAGRAIDMLVTGKTTDVHQVMVAVEEAGVALDLMIEIRNRVLEGYQELIRMQV